MRKRSVCRYSLEEFCILLTAGSLIPLVGVEAFISEVNNGGVLEDFATVSSSLLVTDKESTRFSLNSTLAEIPSFSEGVLLD